jgi:hypothetical protein
MVDKALRDVVNRLPPAQPWPHGDQEQGRGSPNGKAA